MNESAIDDLDQDLDSDSDQNQDQDEDGDEDQEEKVRIVIRLFGFEVELLLTGRRVWWCEDRDTRQKAITCMGYTTRVEDPVAKNADHM